MPRGHGHFVSNRHIDDGKMEKRVKKIELKAFKQSKATELLFKLNYADKENW